jgi:hypothetical protein
LSEFSRDALSGSEDIGFSAGTIKGAADPIMGSKDLQYK